MDRMTRGSRNLNKLRKLSKEYSDKREAPYRGTFYVTLWDPDQARQKQITMYSDDAGFLVLFYDLLQDKTQKDKLIYALATTHGVNKVLLHLYSKGAVTNRELVRTKEVDTLLSTKELPCNAATSRCKGGLCMFGHDCEQNDRHECPECYFEKEFDRRFSHLY
jgi:hypothetical protein